MPSLPKAGLPPEIAGAIEFTPEFRHAMGFFDEPEIDEITRVPSKKEIEAGADLTNAG